MHTNTVLHSHSVHVWQGHYMLCLSQPLFLSRSLSRARARTLPLSLSPPQAKALCLASEHGHLKIVELLIAHDVDVNATNAAGRNSYELAAKYPAIQRALLLSDRLNADTKVTINPCRFSHCSRISTWNRKMTQISPSPRISISISSLILAGSVSHNTLIHNVSLDKGYRVANTHRIPYLYWSFSAKEPYIYRIFCGKWSAT